MIAPAGDDAWVRTILEARASRLRAPIVTESQEVLVHLAEIPIGREQFALPLRVLRGAVPLRLVQPVPLAPPHIVGIFRHEGRIVSALSLASLLGVRGWRRDPSILVIVEVQSGRLAAFDSESIPRPVHVRADAIHQARSQAPTATILNVFSTTGEVLRVIEDVQRLIDGAPEAADVG